MNGKIENHSTYTVKIESNNFLGIKPGIYRAVKCNKGYRMFIWKDSWVGIPKELVERNKNFRRKYV